MVSVAIELLTCTFVNVVVRLKVRIRSRVSNETRRRKCRVIESDQGLGIGGRVRVTYYGVD